MSDQPSPAPVVPPWKNPRVVAAAIGALLFLIFVIQNSGRVEVDFLFWNFGARLIILMILCAAAGVGIWELGKYVWRRRQAL